MINSNDIVRFCDEILNEKTCSILARNSLFVQRSSSKLKGYEFIKAMIIPSSELSTDSLQGICKRIEEFNPEANISAQALCERINDISSKKLMKSVFALILQHMHSKILISCPKLTKALCGFHEVLIEDSTVMKLNEKLQAEFKGTNRGGSGAKSQVKIDLIYNLMKGALVDAALLNGNEPDQGVASRIIKYVKPNDLVIRDLGYFVLGSLKKIAKLGAYYLSRLLPNIKVYLNKDDAQPVDLGRYVEKKFPRQACIELDVYLGDEKVPSRMILYRQPKDITEKKMREANKQARVRGRQMSQGKKLCLQFAIFITNVPKEILTAEVIGTIYRLRWEVELVFKRWKSSLEIDYLKGIDKNRIECLIWSRLCVVMIIEILHNYISRVLEKKLNREISHVKLIKYILRESRFCRAIVTNQLEKYLKEMEKDAQRMLLKDKRYRRTMRERVCLNESYYEKQSSKNQKVA